MELNVSSHIDNFRLGKWQICLDAVSYPRLESDIHSSSGTLGSLYIRAALALHLPLFSQTMPLPSLCPENCPHKSEVWRTDPVSQSCQLWLFYLAWASGIPIITPGSFFFVIYSLWTQAGWITKFIFHPSWSLASSLRVIQHVLLSGFQLSSRLLASCFKTDACFLSNASRFRFLY